VRFLGANFELDLMRVQALRSDPPGEVRTLGHRKRVFAAGLEQFDGLARAAGEVGPPVAPILLFYALAQANQAVAAARIPGKEWRPVGHGLSVLAPTDVLGDVIISPDDSERSSFRRFCQAIGSDWLTAPVTLGEAWASVPLLKRVDGLGSDFPDEVRLEARGPDQAYLLGPVTKGLMPPIEEATATLTARLEAIYPKLSTGVLVEGFGSPRPDRDEEGVLVSWRDDAHGRRPIDEIAPPLLGEGGGAALPRPLSTGDVLSPIAAWWVVSLALSSVARYRPDLWRASLDRDKTPIAIAVEDGLGATRELLPIIVMWALTGTGWST
jgi:hypothetical protein